MTLGPLASSLEYVVFGGGSMHGLMYPGVLQELVGTTAAAREWRDTVLRGAAGTSVGALFAAMVLVWTPQDMLGFLGTITELEDAMKRSSIKDMASSMYRRSALTSGEDLRKMISRGVAAMFPQCGNNPEAVTFGDVHAWSGGKFLAVVATNAATGAPKTWSTHGTPSTSLCAALVASASLPVVFPVAHVDGVPYVDGGLVDNLPLASLPERVWRGSAGGRPRVLACYVAAGPIHVCPPTIKIMYNVATHAAQIAPLRHVPLYRWYTLVVPCTPPTPSSSSFNFKITADTVVPLVRAGTRAFRAIRACLALAAMVLCHSVPPAPVAAD